MDRARMDKAGGGVRLDGLGVEVDRARIDKAGGEQGGVDGVGGK